MDIIRVAARSRPRLVAGAIAGQVREHRSACVQAIGAGAVNQAVMAIIAARSFLQADGLDLTFIPTFVLREINGMERTAIQFVVQVRGETGGSGS